MLDTAVAFSDSSSGETRTPFVDRVRPRVVVPQRIASGVLLGGGKELVIEHDGQEYHLRLTRNDKLILTK